MHLFTQFQSLLISFNNDAIKAVIGCVKQCCWLFLCHHKAHPIYICWISSCDWSLGFWCFGNRLEWEDLQTNLQGKCKANVWTGLAGFTQATFLRPSFYNLFITPGRFVIVKSHLNSPGKPVSLVKSASVSNTNLCLLQYSTLTPNLRIINVCCCCSESHCITTRHLM